MTKHHKTFKLFTLSLLAGAIMLSGCNRRGTQSLVTKTKMQQVKTAKKLEDLRKASNNNTDNLNSGILSELDTVPTPEADAGGNSATERDYSTTNVQVDGVDEGDIIKTDGEQIFYAPNYSAKFYVFDVDHNYEMTIAHEIVTSGFQITSLYLTPDYVITLSYGHYQYSAHGNEAIEDVVDPSIGEAEPEIYYLTPSVSGTKITLYERVNFTVSFEVQFNYYISEHRLINNSLFFVGDKYLYDTNIVPEHRINDEEVSLLSYHDMYYFESDYFNSMTVIGGLLVNKNPEHIKLNEKAYLTNHFYLRGIYVSHENLYLLNSNYIYERDHSYQTTTISQFKLNVATATTNFVAASSVKGTTLSQFSVDEYDGYLRIATTNVSSSWRTFANGNYDWESYRNEVTNYLFILKANARTEDFTLIGYIDDGLGKPGESIKSVRFDGEKALIVTFLNIDPLYVINLSDPANPVITDAIELPGYDVYQHNWGANRALGFGYSANLSGAIDGMKLTAYDVTEGSSSELETFHIFSQYNDGHSGWSYGYSEALYNHRAMLVHVGKGLFGIPVHASITTVVNGHYYYEYFGAYYLFKINFDTRPIIQPPLKIEHARSENYGYGYVDRAVMIDDFLYTFSNKSVVVLDLVTEDISATLAL